MTIKRTAKYVAAESMARKLAIRTKPKTADDLYSKIEGEGFYWDSKVGQWLERAQVDPRREMDKNLIRVRVTAHMDYLEAYTDRIVKKLETDGFTIQEVSKPYPNVRDSDGAGRIYIAIREPDED